MEAYQSETGDYVSKPLAIGGGTYARDSKNSVAFGMQFPGIDSKMHEGPGNS
jgi:succinyl-diaminopimelate desuccinylase